jgi:hypothetical protein
MLNRYFNLGFYLLMTTILLSIKVTGQTLCNEITKDMGYTVSSVKINARWVSPTLQKRVEQIVGLGQRFDPSKLATAEIAVRNELIKDEGWQEFWLLKGSTSILFIYSQACTSTQTNEKKVAIEINPYYLRIDLFNVGNNILPVPRSARPSFYDHVPLMLKATTPIINFSSDRQYGPAIGVITNTDLLHLPGTNNSKQEADRLSADVNLFGRKSFSKAYYDIGVQMGLAKQAYNKKTLGWNIGLQWAKSLIPWGSGQNNTNNWLVQGGVQGNTEKRLISKWASGIALRSTQNTYNSSHENNSQKDEKGLQLYALTDTKAGKSFMRLGIWFDAAAPDKEDNISNYQRLTSRFGYSHFLGNGHNSALIEAVAGGGYTWGTAPIYSQYVAGNTNRNFLYEPINSFRNQTIQNGPLVRSLGENEGGLSTINGNTVGGSSFWHLNLNFSVPIARWSRPLIPDIAITEDTPPRTLRSALKAASNDAATFICDDLIKNQGYPDNDDTYSAANAIVDKDIRPTIDYLADRANVYSVKPLLLFDIGRLNDHILSGKTFTAIGAGLQATIVIARLEIGYMHTLSPSDYNSRGNFFLSFVMQNFY